VAATDALHEGKDRVRDIDQSEDVGIEPSLGGVDQHIDATKAIAGLKNRSLDLLVLRDIELDDEGLGWVTLDQVAHRFRPASRDHRSLPASQHRLGERTPDANGRSRDEPNPFVG
jgi:hypothetical protein